MKINLLLFWIVSFIFHLSSKGQPDFNPIDSVTANKEIDSMVKIYKMDESRAKLIEIEKEDDRSPVVEAFNKLSPWQMAKIMINRLHQALTVSSLSMLQKRVIVWTMKKIKPGLYDHKNPDSREEAKKIFDIIQPVISNYFSTEQICLLYTECSLRGIEK